MNDDDNADDNEDDCDGEVAVSLVMIVFKLTGALNCNTLMCNKYPTNE